MADHVRSSTLLSLLQPNAWPISVLIDEYYAGRFKGIADRVKRHPPRLPSTSFEIDDRP
ncbi:hypothetical protein L614_004000000040 [Ochrobactrum sp. J50]|nr:hypothetical protein L614_004000000040 [Ochrobactrum sp. J50]